MSKYVHSAGQSLLLAISLFGLFSSLFIRSISLFIDTPWSAFSKANSRTAQSLKAFLLLLSLPLSLSSSSSSSSVLHYSSSCAIVNQSILIIIYPTRFSLALLNRRRSSSRLHEAASISPCRRTRRSPRRVLLVVVAYLRYSAFSLNHVH